MVVHLRVFAEVEEVKHVAGGVFSGCPASRWYIRGFAYELHRSLVGCVERIHGGKDKPWASRIVAFFNQVDHEYDGFCARQRKCHGALALSPRLVQAELIAIK